MTELNRIRRILINWCLAPIVSQLTAGARHQLLKMSGHFCSEGNQGVDRIVGAQDVGQFYQ